MKILVTAFKPFNNSPNNLSIEVLNHITNVDKIILDVIYDKCYQILSSSFNLDEYDLIIALGEARMRTEISVEKQAKNISSCSLPDNDGQILKDKQIIPNSLDVLTTKINLDRIKDLISTSNDAGKFVCNNLYYHLLYNYSNKSIFIHIPSCNESDYKNYASIINKIITRLIYDN